MPTPPETEEHRDHPTRRLSRERFMDVTRALVWTFQSFEAIDKQHIRELGLTRSQFDVLATLGNTEGMRLQDLAHKTLITKSSLTGVVDRLESRGLLRRVVPEDDKRSFVAVLTPEGEAMFNQVFPAHLLHIKRYLGRLTPQEMDNIEAALTRLREVLTEAQ